MPLLAAAGLAALATLLAACGGRAAGQAPRPVVTLYSGQHVQTTAALVSAFERSTGIEVRVRNDDEDVLANQIAQEGRATPADVVDTENSPPLEFLSEKGLLATLDPATLASVNPAYRSPTGQWVGVSARVTVLVYNTRLLKPAQLPGSVLDLAQPRWRGKLALAPGETDFQPVVTSVAKTYGRARALQWLQGLKLNADGHIYPDNETVTNMVNRGDAAIGIVNHYYWYRERAIVGSASLHSAIAYFAPRDAGYVLDISGAAVLRHSGGSEAAQRLVAFLVSRQAQEIIAHDNSYEYPLADGVISAQPLRPFATLEPAPLSAADLGDGSMAVGLLQAAQLL